MQDWTAGSAAAAAMHDSTSCDQCIWLSLQAGAARYGAAKGSADFKAMDTNGDGNLDSGDDPFMPYYPGEQHSQLGDNMLSYIDAAALC